MKKEYKFKNLDFESVKPNNSLSEKIEDEMTSYFYRNVFKAYQELYNYIVDYVEYLEHLLKMNKIPFDRKNIK
jgi:hypothetical protein